MGLMKILKYKIEAAAVWVLFAVFRSLPLDVASWLGGFMARSIGPFLRANKIAKNNLKMIYPKMTFPEQHKLIMAMWDNLGRVAAELPWLATDELFKRMNVTGTEYIPRAGKPAIFFSGHIGNWELCYPIAHNAGIPTTLIYREANNPYVDKIISGIRAKRSSHMLPKGARNAIKIARAIKDGHALAMLVDQKMNEGIAVPFFGRDAMTAPAIAEFALRYDMPLIPARVFRTHGCHFEGKVYPPLVVEKTGDTEKDVLAIMKQINAQLESWIREHPEQWFWVHKRWPNA